LQEYQELFAHGRDIRQPPDALRRNQLPPDYIFDFFYGLCILKHWGLPDFLDEVGRTTYGRYYQDEIKEDDGDHPENGLENIQANADEGEDEDEDEVEDIGDTGDMKAQRHHCAKWCGKGRTHRLDPMDILLALWRGAARGRVVEDKSSEDKERRETVEGWVSSQQSSPR
jgi:hypothetical protein